ncbi:hypothetical protein ACRYCC_22305 [Actinomadura scrupuli]|uniref:hypothetical protein n=1 Tax=Actinomadura scrupuli TaxID=559629 RepID=UPI003D97A654
MHIPTPLALTVTGLAFAAGNVFAVGAAITQANAATGTTAPQTQTTAVAGHSCDDFWGDCDGWGDWDDWDD